MKRSTEIDHIGIKWFPNSRDINCFNLTSFEWTSTQCYTTGIFLTSLAMAELACSGRNKTQITVWLQVFDYLFNHNKQEIQFYCVLVQVSILQ